MDDEKRLETIGSEIQDLTDKQFELMRQVERNGKRIGKLEKERKQIYETRAGLRPGDELLFLRERVLGWYWGNQMASPAIEEESGISMWVKFVTAEEVAVGWNKHPVSGVFTRVVRLPIFLVQEMRQAYLDAQKEAHHGE